MDDRTRRYQPGQEDEPMELNDVLEPYRGSEDGADRFADDGGDYDPYAYGPTTTLPIRTKPTAATTAMKPPRTRGNTKAMCAPPWAC